MTEYDAFVRNILDNPGDDTLRLVFADFLEDRVGTTAARARAEFIRLQCERESHKRGEFAPSPGNDRRQDFVDRRVAGLLKTWGAGWLPKAGRYKARMGVSAAFTSVAVETFGFPDHYVFHRGFVDQVEATFASGVGMEMYGVGNWVRSLLAACPLSRFVLAVRDHAPGLVFEFERFEFERFEGGGPGHDWRCRLTDDEGNPLSLLVGGNRRELVTALPGFVESTLAGIDFERVRDYDDFDGVDDVYYGPDPPDWYGP